MKEGKKLKVLQLGKLYYPAIGGIEKTMQQIAEGIQGEVDSFVLAAQPRGKAYEKSVNGVHVYYAKSWGTVASLPVSFDLVFYLCKHAGEYDVIHLHMPFPLGDLACLLSGFHGKLVVYWHSDIVRQKKMMILYRPLMNRLLKRADVICIATKGNIDGSNDIKPYADKCRLVPFAVGKGLEERSDAYWEKRHLNESERGMPLRLLFIGRLVYYKGCDVLLEAMRGFQGEQVELVIIGGGVLEAQLKEQTHRYHLEKQVCFLGKVSDEELIKEIEKTDVFVFPSVANSEAFGLVQLEAMVYGKPVINTNLSTGVPWVSLNGVTGLTVPVGDAKRLADAIRWMQEHPDERKLMGENARRRVKTEYTEEIMIRRLLGIYKERE